MMTDDLVLYAYGTAVCILRCSLVEGFLRLCCGFLNLLARYPLKLCTRLACICLDCFVLYTISLSIERGNLYVGICLHGDKIVRED
jgi:hypothetical protein